MSRADKAYRIGIDVCSARRAVLHSRPGALSLKSKRGPYIVASSSIVIATKPSSLGKRVHGEVGQLFLEPAFFLGR